MNVDLLWWLGAPVAGGGIITAGIIVPRLKHRQHGLTPASKDGARVLPLRSRAAAVSDAAEAHPVDRAGQSPDAPTAVTDESPTIAAESAPAIEASVEAVGESNVARPAFGARMARGLRSAFRRKRADETDAPAPHDIAAQAGEDTDALPALLLAAPTIVPFAPVAAEEAPVIQESVALTRALVSFEPEGERGPAENGIIHVDVPAGEDPMTWRAGVAAREAQLRETNENAERLRHVAVAEEERRRAEVAAQERQIHLENIALAEEVSVRTEARLRNWYARLDLDLEAPTVEVRMAMASSLAVVRAVWAGKLLREAFYQEDEARVRARVIGALVSGHHLDVTDPFYTAFENGGIERAATFEMLMPRQDEAKWIIDLLAPLLVA